MSSRRATFRVEAIHPSLNTWSRGNPFKVAGLKKAHDHIAQAAIHQAKVHGAWDGQPFERARVTVRYHFPTAVRHDPDNGAPKFFLDALVAGQVLTDDDFAHVPELTITSGERAKPGWTELIVEEVDA